MSEAKRNVSRIRQMVAPVINRMAVHPIAVRFPVKALPSIRRKSYPNAFGRTRPSAQLVAAKLKWA